MRLSVVIPIYNEIETLEEIVARVRAVDIDKEIILVDDGSTDGSRDLVRKFENDTDTQVIFHEVNQDNIR